MDKLKKEKKGLIYSSIGLFFTFVGMMLISLKRYDTIALIITIIGVIIAIFGVTKIKK